MSKKFFLQYLPFVLLIALSSCGMQFSPPTNSLEFLSVNGSVPVLSGLISRQDKNSFYAYAAGCTATASLYLLDNNDMTVLPALSSVDVKSDGTFSLNVDPNVISNSKVAHLIEVSGEGTCDVLLQRPLTNPSNLQVVTPFSTLISYGRESSLNKKMVEVTKDQIETLLNGTSTIIDPNVAYNELTTNRAVEFNNVFQDPPAKLLDAAPVIKEKIVPGSSLLEGSINNFKIVAYHWNPGYDLAAQWKLDGVNKSLVSAWSFIPGGDSSGSKSLEIYVGADDGTGKVDVTKAFHYITQNFTIQNNILPSPPQLDFAQTVVASTSINVNMLTGAGLVNCQSFDSLAVTADDATVPLFFLLNCTTPNSQSIPLTLSSGDGDKLIRLWARDHEGQISALPSTLTVTLDQTAPTLSMLAPTGLLAGGTTSTLTMSATDLHGVDTLDLSYSSDNGSTWTAVASLAVNTTSYNWTVPAINSTQVKLKLVGVDNLGNSRTIVSPSFSVDSTLPAAPSVTLASATPTNSTSTSITLASCTDFSGIYLAESATAPVASATGWVSCAGTLAYTLASSTNGNRRIYTFSKDAAGNVSTSSYVDLVFDNVAPAAPSVALASGGEINSDTSTMTISTCTGIHSVKVTEDTTQPLVGDTGWQVCSTSAGAITHTLTNTTEGNKTLRIWSKDSASSAANVSASSASITFVLDKTAPTLDNLVLNPTGDSDNIGDAFTGTANIIARIKASDALSATIQIKVLELTSANLVCQDFYANTDWKVYNPTSAGGPVNYFLTSPPLDGVKKICAWAKDLAGNTSLISGSTPETLNVNFDTINYEVGNVPFVSDFSVINNSGSVRQGTENFTLNEAAQIDFTIQDIEGLNNNPISISYNVSGSTVWKDLFTNADVAVSSNVTWFGGLSGNPTTYTGNQSLPAPSGTYFKLKLIVRDRAGNISIPVYSNVMNGGSWSIYAGNRDKGDGGTGLSAVLKGGLGTQLFTINPLNNDIYATDLDGVHIRKLDAKTGLVSTAITNGTINLTDGGTLPASIQIPLSSTNPVKFDSKGRFYVPTSTNSIWQIDFTANISRYYIIKGNLIDSSATWNTVAAAGGPYAFDEDDSMYFYASCVAALGTKAVRIMKLTQNTNGTPGSVSIVAGDCTEGNAAGNGPYDALNTPLGTAYDPVTGLPILPSVGLGALTVWGRGRYIYYYHYQGSPTVNKIIDGQWYKSAIPVANRSFIINFNDEKIYMSSGAVLKYTPNLLGANGETFTTYIPGSNTGNCNAEDVIATSACVRSGSGFGVTSSGVILFADGSINNSVGTYRIRYMDPTSSKIKTLFGSPPFYGDNLKKNLIRGDIAGIYYKKSTEGNLTAYPEGLYFFDKGGLVINHIDPATQQTRILFGNQSLTPMNVANGGVMNNTVSLGTPYAGGDGMALTFDEEGLPWFRAQNKLYSMTSTKTLVNRMTGGTYWSNSAEGADPALSWVYVFGTSHNLTLSDDGVFLMGVASAVATGGNNLLPSIRYFDFTNVTTKKIMGDLASAHSADNATPGAVKDLALTCGYGTACFSYYDRTNDILYYTENGYPKIRYITSPRDPTSSTLGSITLARNPSNFTFRPDGNEVYYASGGLLYCKNLTGAGTCNETSLGPNAFIGVINTGANQFTWADNNTLLISTYNGLILRYQVP